MWGGEVSTVGREGWGDYAGQTDVCGEVGGSERGGGGFPRQHQLFKTQSSFWPAWAGIVAPHAKFMVSDSVK